jgi:hypothetical protein
MQDQAYAGSPYAHRSMSAIDRADQTPVFDASQFKLQPDGTFRISIRGMAAMTGVDHAGIVRSLKSAGDEKPLPCARSLVLQGFSPGDVTAWGETGGIPEDAAPFILEHYAFTAASPSAQARMVLLAFSRVGINAYLKERLGVDAVSDTPAEVPALTPLEYAGGMLKLVNDSLDILDRLGGADERERMVYRDLVNNTVVRSSGNALLAPAQATITLSEALIQCGAPAHKATKLATRFGRQFKNLYRSEHDGAEPRTHRQNVGGRECLVADYELDWAAGHFARLKEWLSDWLN